MSWLYSQALVAEFSAGTCSDGEPSARLSATPTPQAFCAPDRTTAFSRLSRYGMTFAPLTGDRGADVLTSFLAGFPVRTSALPERAQDSAESVPASGPKWLASWAKYDRDTFSWKTAQLSFLEDLGASSVTWPRSGLMRRGECYPLKTLELRISEIESGSLLPTPCTVDSGSYFNQSKSSGASLRPTLGAMARHNLWPTPSANEDAAGTINGNMQYMLTHAAKESDPAGTSVGGQLNPTWVEWLMGWPLGWTDLKPSGTDKFQEWQRQHSLNSQERWSKAA